MARPGEAERECFAPALRFDPVVRVTASSGTLIEE